MLLVNRKQEGSGLAAIATSVRRMQYWLLLPGIIGIKVPVRSLDLANRE